MSIGARELQAALPDVRGTLKLPGLSGSVEIIRDQFGIPHVRAGSLADAFFAQGFVHAQDRLWQMEFDRRRASGRWAECTGRPAIEQDTLMRRLGLIATSRHDYEAYDVETRLVFDSYAAGVNAFIDSTRALPVEFGLLGITPERWEPWHSGAVFKIRHTLMGVWGSKLWRARVLDGLGPELAVTLGTYGVHDGVLIVPPGAEFASELAELSELLPGAAALQEAAEISGGSNNWVVAGSRTASGKPLMAGDPHRPLDVPGVYYQNHLACPEFDAIGFSFGGVPGFPHFAHNAHAAWAITHAMADYQDLYVERFRTDDTGRLRYEYLGDWRTAGRWTETIGVRNAEPVEIDIVRTHHGPVVVGNPATGYAITMRYTATDVPNPGLCCLLPMLRARSVDELDESMRQWVDPCNNMVLADRNGTIAYLHRGRVPVRDRANGWLPVPGWTGEHEWQGDISFEQLPRERDPITGFIATANNRVVGKEYPHYLAVNYAPPHRARRVVDRLNTLINATIADMAGIHADRVSLPSATFRSVISDVSSSDPRVADAQRRLLDWDGVMDRDLVPPTIYAATRDQLARNLEARPKLSRVVPNPYQEEPLAIGVAGRLWGPLLTMIETNDVSLLAVGETWTDALGEALAGSVARLTEALGPDIDSWTWGRLHTTKPIHPLAGVYPDAATLLNPPGVPMGGDGDTVQAAAFAPGVSFNLASMSVARYAFDLADWDNSGWVVPLGASAHPGSPHFADQTLAWSEVRLNPMLYTWERITADAESTQSLEP
jgi:penicillin amidase